MPSSPKNDKANLRAEILELVSQYHDAAFLERAFVPGKTYLPPSGKVCDAKEMQNIVESALDCWLTTGRFADEFEKKFAQWIGVKHCSLVNSGSSANLVALTALTSHLLGDKRLKPGDEVITVATGFPTTVNPILQNQLVPVFIDVSLPTYNADMTQLKKALSPKTRAIMMAHTLGNPFDVAAVMAFARAHDLWVMEDNCDALGSLYDGKKTGTFGHISTMSFYPAHHMTMGEGGAVLTNDDLLNRIINSFRDWGRDCWCKTGACNTCGKRFGWKLGDLPEGYDHKYIYSHVGYSMKVTDMQAAVGLAQLKKLDGFVARRRANFVFLSRALAPLKKYFVLPEATPDSDPSWFGFPLTVREESGLKRTELVQELERRGVGTRQLFAGNITRQPAYQGLRYRTVGKLPGADRVMNDTFWVGLYPGLTEAMLTYTAKTLADLCVSFK
ncbi:MAG: lipopolysaccharide biosynthesis protein RfbH [Candidatus Peribacteraceae bacterium]|nr:lipopolysaccharide biosynthesis protein RfbH [Candidatus Peribacteraceae bacterium]MDD5741999.1 lipopolysaccharide biosynthesis protein RfbH [Candidatus Peribacteraceae bacterium]